MATNTSRQHGAKRFPILALMFVALTSVTAWALPEAPGPVQEEAERNLEAVVRHKNFFKTGRMEITGLAGIMPYDSLINHYMVGGRLTWHFSDHYAWEILDASFTFPQVTAFTTNLVSQKGISNLQTTMLRQMFATNLIVSPIYGKIRWFGASVLHFDTYLVAGLGLANTDTLYVHAAGTGQPAIQDVLRSGFEPMFNFGLGFKIFLNNAVGLVVDLRDYVVLANSYGSSQLKSNFSFYLGLTFFIPTFG